MRFWSTSPALFALFSALLVQVSAAADAPTVPETPGNSDPPCTATSPTSGNFFDLRPLIRTAGNKARDTDWVAKGLDYNANFTINICAPVLADVTQVEGIKGDAKKNVSAFYEKDGEMYSIGFVAARSRLSGIMSQLTSLGAYPQTSTLEGGSWLSSTLMAHPALMPRSYGSRR